MNEIYKKYVIQWVVRKETLNKLKFSKNNLNNNFVNHGKLGYRVCSMCLWTFGVSPTAYSVVPIPEYLKSNKFDLYN